MADKVSLMIDSVTQAGIKNSKTVTFVNPAAARASLASFAQGLNDLTTNTLTGARLMTVSDLELADEGEGN